MFVLSVFFHKSFGCEGIASIHSSTNGVLVCTKYSIAFFFQGHFLSGAVLFPGLSGAVFFPGRVWFSINQLAVKVSVLLTLHPFTVRQMEYWLAQKYSMAYFFPGQFSHSQSWRGARQKTF